MSAFIPWVVLLGLAAMVARYLRNESTTRRKNEDQHRTTLGEVLEAVTSLRSALVASGAIERLAQHPPPSPRVSPPSKRPGLPRKQVTVTKDRPQIEPAPSPTLDDTLASAGTPDVNDEADEGRVTDEEGTRVFTRVKRPPPHRPSRPSRSRS